MGSIASHKNYEELADERAKVRNRINELESKLSNSIDSDSSKLSEEEREDIKEKLKELESQLAEINARIHSFEDSYSSNERTRKVESQIDDLSKEIDNINTLLEDKNLQEKKEILENLIENNRQLEQETQELKQKLSDLTSKKVGESLGEEFENRRENIERSVKIWGSLTGISILVLIGTAGVVYRDIVNADSSTVMLSKIALLLPVSVAVWFTSSNYSRERRLMEEYAFKSTMSYSLDGYRKVVEEQLSDKHSEKMADFLSKSLLKIFSNPTQTQQTSANQGSGQGLYAEIARRIASE